MSGIHGGYQHELRRKCHGAGRAGNGDDPFFQRLAHGFEHTALEFRQLVQEQHAVVRQGDFAGRGIDIAAEQAGVACGVMRRSEGPACNQSLSRFEQAHDTMNFSGFQSLWQRQRRQDRGDALTPSRRGSVDCTMPPSEKPRASTIEGFTGKFTRLIVANHDNYCVAKR